MQHLLLSILFLVITIKSADIFIDQSISLAKKLKISSFIIGFTLIALGTSLPEFIISTYSTYTNHPEISISNVLGSCIANITLVIGLVAIYKPYKLSKTDVFFNIPVSLLSLILFLILLVINNYVVTLAIGIIFLVLLPVFLTALKKENHCHKIKDSKKFNIILLILSLISLTIFGRLCVNNILDFAEIFNIKESLLGYFVIAIGTSFLEFVTCMTAIKKGDEEMGIGNILGSNLLNIYLILGSSALIQSLDLSSFRLEIFLLILFTSVISLLALIGKKFYFSKKEGWILILSYILFVFLQLFLL